MVNNVMHHCIKNGCHVNPTDILIHGQEIIMATLAQVQADLAKAQADNAQFRTDVKAAFARLQTSIDNNTLDPAALQALDDAINSDDAATVADDAAANAEDPDTSTPPADGSEPTA